MRSKPVFMLQQLPVLLRQPVFLRLVTEARTGTFFPRPAELRGQPAVSQGGFMDLGPSRSLWLRYGVALLTVALAVPLTAFCFTLGHGSSAFFFAAVMISAWYGGFGPGFLTTALSALALDFFFLPPLPALGTGLDEGMRLGVFVVVAFLIGTLAAREKRRREDLQEQGQQKDRFLAVLAHELLSPLSASLNALLLLRLRGTEDLALKEAQDMMGRQLHQMACLINDVLDVSRISAGKLPLHRERIELAEAAARAVETIRPLVDARGHRLELDLPGEGLCLEADPTRLQQILVNLLSNAAKYTEPGGHIRLTAAREGGEIALRVRDSGIGIPPDVLPHVFEPFIQAESGSGGGLGIGLSLVRSLVDMHGGRVTASSPGPGHGSEFVVRLPAPGGPCRAKDHGLRKAARVS